MPTTLSSSLTSTVHVFLCCFYAATKHFSASCQHFTPWNWCERKAIAVYWDCI